jgi:hypothetical protein
MGIFYTLYGNNFYNSIYFILFQPFSLITYLSISHMTKGDNRRQLLEMQLRRGLNLSSGEYISSYLDDVGGDEERAERLAEAAALLETIVQVMLNENISLKKWYFFEDLESVLKSWQLKDFPKAALRIKEKVAQVLVERKKITDVIGLPRVGNQNSRKYDDKEVLSWCYNMRSSGDNYTNSYITRRITDMCGLTCKATPSTSWFETLFATHEMKVLTAQGRFGKRGRRAQLYQGYNPIDTTALFANDVWQADGSRFQLINWTNKDGKAVFLWIVVIRDAMSGRILGWSFGMDGVKENRWMYLEALTDAVTNTGCLPHQLVVDRFPGHNSDDWKAVDDGIRRLGGSVWYAHKASGKAQVERWFGTLQTVFVAQSKYYYGEGIMSKRPYAHRSIEQLATIRKTATKEGWNFNKASAEAEKVLNAYNQTPLSYYSRKYKKVDKSPEMLYDECDSPHAISIEAYEIARLLWSRTEITVAHQMISPIIEGFKFHFEISEEIFFHHKQVVVCYNLDDLSAIHCFSMKNEAYLGKFERIEGVKIHGPEADYAALAKSNARIKALDNAAKEALGQKTAHSDAGMVDILMTGLTSKENAENGESDYLADSFLPQQATKTVSEAQKTVVEKKKTKNNAKGNRIAGDDFPRMHDDWDDLDVNMDTLALSQM